MCGFPHLTKDEEVVGGRENNQIISEGNVTGRCKVLLFYKEVELVTKSATFSITI